MSRCALLLMEKMDPMAFTLIPRHLFFRPAASMQAIIGWISYLVTRVRLWVRLSQYNHLHKRGVPELMPPSFRQPPVNPLLRYTGRLAQMELRGQISPGQRMRH